MEVEGVNPDGYRSVLAEFQSELVGRFAALKQARHDLGAPVFALEHGLPPKDIERLSTAVRACVREGMATPVSRESWLPFVVYSVEVGYSYEGDKFWPGFEDTTPGWNPLNDRDLLVEWFRLFQDQFDGAVPRGPWAEWFKKISLPITHAVLPVYLQRHLAHLLYDCRMLSAHFAHDTAALGLQLAGHAGLYGTRFRQFCENTELLGLVASSLLAGSEAESPYLSRPALERLVNSTMSERQARTWLRKAQAASHVQARGFVRSAGGGDGTGRQQQIAPSPVLSLRRREGKWEVCVKLPDLRYLAAKVPGFSNTLHASRARLVGRQRPLASGRLLDPDQVEALDFWPPTNQPLLTLETASTQVNATLGDFSLKTPGPWWVFRESDNGTAIEVRGKTLRPGATYILLTTERTKPPISWITPVELRTTGVTGFRAVPPADVVSTEDESALITSGLSFTGNVFARPVGLVAAAWDGQGSADWIVGGPMMLGITSEKQVAACQLRVDGEEDLLPWRQGEPHLIVDFQELYVGEHTISIALLDSDSRTVADGQIVVTVKDAPVRPEGGADGEGIRLRVNPTRPTLDEFWQESTSLLVDGPPGATARIEIQMLSDQNRPLTKVSRNVTLPLTDERWRNLSKEIRQDKQITDAYDDADSCLITVSKSGLGFAQLTAERPFRPLRWQIKKGHGRQVAEVELVDHTDDPNGSTRFFDPATPLVSRPWPATSAPIPQHGGLLIAEASGVRAVIVLPPDLNSIDRKTWCGLQQRFIPPGQPSVSRMTELIDGHQAWASADLPGGASAEALRLGVLARIDRSLCEVIAGRDWANGEGQALDKWRTMSIILTHSDQALRQAAEAIGPRLYEWGDESALEDGFVSNTKTVAERDLPHCEDAARFTFCLASRPGVLSVKADPRWSPTDTQKLLKMTLSKPELYKLARMTVIGARQLHDDGNTP